MKEAYKYVWLVASMGCATAFYTVPDGAHAFFFVLFTILAGVASIAAWSLEED